MSHRAMITTQMKDEAILAKTLDSQGIKYRQEGTRFHLLTGAFNGTTIDTRTGQLTGEDVDRNREATDARIFSLRQHYTVTERKEFHFKKGTTVSTETETVKGQQVVVLCCSREA